MAPDDAQPLRAGTRLAWEGCVNVRDLGGFPAEGDRTTRHGAIVRADNLARLTEAGWRALLDHGVRTILDLRHEAERCDDPDGHSARCAGGVVLHENIPLFEEIDHETALAIYTSSTQVEAYTVMLERCRSNLASILTRVARAPAGAVAIHCQSGRDRTGLVAALLLAVAGVAPEHIVDDYAASALYLDRAHAQRMVAARTAEERQQALRRSSAPPRVMHDVLRRIDGSYGGVRSYLRSAGLTDDELERIADRLVG